MAEYIEREAAISFIKEKQCKKCSDIGLCGGCAVLTAIKLFQAVPAADVAPVRHGQWIEYPEVLKLTDALNDEYVGCSVCENVWNRMDNDVERFNYCPNCGAKMDGGEE